MVIKPCGLTDEKSVYIQFLEELHIMLQLRQMIVRYEIPSTRREVVAVVRLIHDAFHRKLARRQYTY